MRELVTAKPRSEPRPSEALVDAYRLHADVQRLRHETVVSVDDVLGPQPGAQTSPELATLASRYGDFTPADMLRLDEPLQRAVFCGDVRSMAMALLRLTRE